MSDKSNNGNSSVLPQPMVTSKPENTPDKARTIEVSKQTKEMPINDISNYYDFPSSNSQAFAETYSKRIPALKEALGNCDTSEVNKG